MKVRAHVLVSGFVQGVFFRSEIRREAMKRDVAGWIQNLAYGRVEAVFEGEEGEVDQLVDFCKKGPPGARVAGMSVRLETYTGEFDGFEISYS